MHSPYTRLYEHYKQMFALVDRFCFNSRNTRRIYRDHLDVPQGSAVLPMVHAGMTDRRVHRAANPACMRFGFIGSGAPFKGLPLLKGVLAELQKEGVNNWSLSVWGGRSSEGDSDSRISYRGTYAYEQLQMVFDHMDLLIVPSICNETFSLIALEALSHGMPVLTSSTVGAKDIVANYCDGFVFTDREDLKATLRGLCQDAEPLRRFNECILAQAWPYSHDAHVKDVRAWYLSLLRDEGAR